MKTEIDLYYEKFRYENSDFGTERWFDENNVVVRTICYHSNGNKYSEIFTNKNSKPFIKLKYNIDGEIIYISTIMSEVLDTPFEMFIPLYVYPPISNTHPH